MSEEKRTDRWGWLRMALLAVCVVVFCFSATMTAYELITAKLEDDALRNLSSQVERVRRDASRPTSSPGAQTPDGPPDQTGGDPGPTQEELDAALLAVYASLKEQNPDFFGWLTIENTRIDYPVMHTPEDPEYYIHRSFEKSYSGSGVPFMDGKSYAGCGNYLIYGHHMNNGTMFASLSAYASISYWAEHPVIYFDTPEELGEYEVMAAFYSRVYYQDEEGVFRYYRYADLSDPAVFEEYVTQVKAAALYNTGVTAEYGDQLLTLSTCEYHTTNGRFVVVARKIPNETSTDQ